MSQTRRRKFFQNDRKREREREREFPWKPFILLCNIVESSHKMEKILSQPTNMHVKNKVALITCQTHTHNQTQTRLIITNHLIYNRRDYNEN